MSSSMLAVPHLNGHDWPLGLKRIQPFSLGHRELALLQINIDIGPRGNGEWNGGVGSVCENEELE